MITNRFITILDSLLIKKGKIKNLNLLWTMAIPSASEH